MSDAYSSYRKGWRGSRTAGRELQGDLIPMEKAVPALRDLVEAEGELLYER